MSDHTLLPQRLREVEAGMRFMGVPNARKALLDGSDAITALIAERDALLARAEEAERDADALRRLVEAGARAMAQDKAALALPAPEPAYWLTINADGSKHFHEREVRLIDWDIERGTTLTILYAEPPAPRDAAPEMDPLCNPDEFYSAMVAAAPAEIARDAARLDWLQDQMYSVDFGWTDPDAPRVQDPTTMIMFKWPRACAVGADLRANIDDAIEQEENA